MATSGDPLADVVTLLQPAAPFSKLLTGAGGWAIRRTEFGQPFYCALLDGSSRLLADGHEPVTLQAGDFILIPSAQTFTATSLEPATSMLVDEPPIQLPNGEFRLGTPTGLPDVRMLIGYCTFGSPDAALLVSLLPKLVIVRGERRLTTLMQLVRDESREMRPARDIILMRLLEVLLIEALRSTVGTEASPGLLRGLADTRLVMALRKMHESPAASWTPTQAHHQITADQRFPSAPAAPGVVIANRSSLSSSVRTRTTTAGADGFAAPGSQAARGDPLGRKGLHHAHHFMSHVHCHVGSDCEEDCEQCREPGRDGQADAGRCRDEVGGGDTQRHSFLLWQRANVAGLHTESVIRQRASNHSMACLFRLRRACWTTPLKGRRNAGGTLSRLS